MQISESVLVALFCMVGVFVLLAALAFLIKVFSYVIEMLSKKEGTGTNIERSPEGAQDVLSEGDFSSGNLKLKNVDEPTAAMIMAIVSDESGIPLQELRFKSIKLLTEE